MTTETRARVFALLLLLLVAGVGFAGGVATERMLLSPAGGDAHAAAPAPQEGIRILLRGQDSPDADNARRVRFLLPERLAETLDLTPEQQAEIERILREDQAAIREITERVQQALLTVVERSRQRIEEVLTAEQRARWHAMPRPQLRRGEAPGRS